VSLRRAMRGMKAVSPRPESGLKKTRLKLTLGVRKLPKFEPESAASESTEVFETAR
jgi:hypothetical protein